jgi:hypothetical protein
MGIASLVLGIISVVWSVFGGTWLSALVGLVGIILGAVGVKSKAKCAVAGLVLSIIGTSLGLLFYIACVACAASLGAML